MSTISFGTNLECMPVSSITPEVLPFKPCKGALNFFTPDIENHTATNGIGTTGNILFKRKGCRAELCILFQVH